MDLPEVGAGSMLARMDGNPPTAGLGADLAAPGRKLLQWQWVCGLHEWLAQSTHQGTRASQEA